MQKGGDAGLAPPGSADSARHGLLAHPSHSPFAHPSTLTTYERSLMWVCTKEWLPLPPLAHLPCLDLGIVRGWILSAKLSHDNCLFLPTKVSRLNHLAWVAGSRSEPGSPFHPHRMRTKLQQAGPRLGELQNIITTRL